MGIIGSNRLTRRSGLALIILVLSGMAGNYLGLTLFHGVDFVFGSVATLVAARLYGPYWGAVVAAGLSSHLYLLWGHPYAPIIFAAEAIVVGLLSARLGQINLLLIDGLYWTVLGLPLIWVFYGAFLETSTTGVIMVILKQSVNGLFNALVASILLAHSPIHRWVGVSPERPKIPLHEILLNLMIAFLLVPSFALTVRAGRLAFANAEQSVETRLRIETEEASAQLHAWIDRHFNTLEEIGTVVGQEFADPTGRLEESIRLVTSSSNDYLRLEILRQDGGLVSLARGESSPLASPDLEHLESVARSLRPVVSNLHITEAFPTTPVVTVTYPVVAQGKLVGFVQGYLNPEPAQRILEGLLHDDWVHLSLLDRSDRIFVTLRPNVAHATAFDRSPEGGIAFSAPGRYQRFPEGQSPSMKQWNASYEVMETAIADELGWKLVVEVPLAPYQTRLFDVLIGHLLIVYLLLVGSIPLSWLISCNLTRPLSDLATLTRLLPESLRSGESITWPKSQVRETDSLTTDVQWMASTLRDQFNEIESEARQQRALLSTAMESVSIPIIITDDQAQIVYVNPAFLEIYGYTADEVLGRSPVFLQGAQSDHTAIRRLREALRGRQRTSVDLVNYRKDGTKIDAEMFVAPIFDAAGRLTHFVGIQRDISTRKAVERMRSEFISTVSREVRTPLAAARGALGLLSTNLLHTFDSRSARLLKIATTNTDQLAQLINDLVDLEQIESGRLELRREVCQANHLVEQSLANSRLLFEQAKIELQTSLLPAPVMADADKVVRVLDNLLSNAVKHSDPGTTVQITTRAVAGEVLFMVQDQGRGIPPAHLDRVFERFRYADASNSGQQGDTGLGLPLAKAVIEHLHGRIWAESEVGKGSSFCFTLPTPSTEAGQCPRTVLVCADDRALAGRVEDALEQAPYTLHVARSASAAMTALEEHHYKALLLQTDLPGGGLDFLRRLKQQEQFRSLPVILVGSDSLTKVAKPLGPIMDWLENPVNGPRLAQAIRTILRRDENDRGSVLLVDDLPTTRQPLTQMLQQLGVEVILAESDREDINLSQFYSPDLVMVDLLMQNGGGFSVIDQIRQNPKLTHTPLLVYTARDLTDEDLEQLQLSLVRCLNQAWIADEEFPRQVVELLNNLTRKA